MLDRSPDHDNSTSAWLLRPKAHLPVAPIFRRRKEHWSARGSRRVRWAGQVMSPVRRSSTGRLSRPHAITITGLIVIGRTPPLRAHREGGLCLNPRRCQWPRPSSIVDQLGSDLADQFEALAAAIRGRFPSRGRVPAARLSTTSIGCAAAGANPDPFFRLDWDSWAASTGHPSRAYGPVEGRSRSRTTGRTRRPGGVSTRGPAYYFAGMRDIALGNLDRGFLTCTRPPSRIGSRTGDPMPPRPAICFVTLDPRHVGQAYRDKVVEYERSLEARLASTGRPDRGALSVADYRDRAQRHVILLDVVDRHPRTVVARTTSLASRARLASGPASRRAHLEPACTPALLVVEDLMLACPRLPGRTFKPLAAWYAPQATMALSDAELGQLMAVIAAFRQTLTEVLDGAPSRSLRTALVRPRVDLVAAYGVRYSLPTAWSGGGDRVRTSTD